MKYTLEIEIEKPLAEVTGLFGDEKNLAKWQPGYLGRKEIDGKTCLKYQHGKRRFEMVETIITDDLPREFTANYRVPGMVMEVQNLFTAIDANRTRWISNNDCQSSGFMKIMMWLMPGCAKKQSLAYMTHFKALAEKGEDVRDKEK